MLPLFIIILGFFLADDIFNIPFALPRGVLAPGDFPTTTENAPATTLTGPSAFPRYFGGPPRTASNPSPISSLRFFYLRAVIFPSFAAQKKAGLSPAITPLY